MMENKTKIDLKNKSIFITGVAGFIGSNLAKRLLSTVEGVKVVGLDNMNHYYDVRLKEARLNELEQFDNFSFVKGNLADKAVIESIFEQYKPEIVVNLGAQAGVRYSITNPDAYVEANLIGFYTVIRLPIIFGLFNGADGCQITTEAAAEILTEIEKLDIFADVRTSGFEAGVANGSIRYISDEVYTAFVEQVKAQSVLFGEKVNKNAAIVYSPLNGTGLKPVTRTLKEMGYTNITVVKEQEQPDGNFPTCPYPNPEIKEAMALGMEYAKKCNADLLLATDPDCDRVGIAVKNKAGEYELLTGNQTGMLLLDYICSQRVKHGKMPADPVMVKTIVTMDMGEQIATHYGLRTINVLTGFKFIGEQIGKLEQQGRADSYVFGFEESYGYLTGSYVRDKDGVDGAYMICEMFSYYATKGISLLDKLEELYKIYGYCLNTLHSYEFDGSAGFAKMQRIMQAFRGGIKEFGGKKVVKLLDYAPGLDGLPKSDVLKFLLEDNCSIVVRPSGTEPKLKTYISISAENKETAEKIEAEICKSAEEYLK